MNPPSPAAPGTKRAAGDRAAKAQAPIANPDKPAKVRAVASKSDAAPLSNRQASERAADKLVKGFLYHLLCSQGKDRGSATPHDHFVSLSLAVRDRLFERKIATQKLYHDRDVKRVYYMSLEFLLGRQLRQNLVNLDLWDALKPRLLKLGIELERLCELEPDPGLGNGGLGRLAACFMDSLSALQMPAYGYGLRYDYGIFDQDIVDGWQVERPDYWLRFGSPWEVVRPEYSCPVRLYGFVEDRVDEHGRYRAVWRGSKTVVGFPYDIPIGAYGSPTVNLLRLWSARAPEMFDLEAFNRGGYVEAVRERALTETITKVLYPADELEVGKELRLVQQYFFVACTLADILRRYEKNHDTYDELPNKVAIQLNDTHPSLAIAELMRILIDDHGWEWKRAWEITTATFGYTNHTLLPEALETWRVSLFSTVLPRHLQIIYEINRRFLEGISSRWPGDMGRVQRMSLIQEQPARAVRMAHLAIVGSHQVNGVAELHSRLIRERLVPDFAELWPEKFTNVTNGVTPRRWLLACNPALCELLTQRAGAGWLESPEKLRSIEKLAEDADFQAAFRAAKAQNKQRLAEYVGARLGVKLDPSFLFDVQVKRLHEYKRQLLNILRVILEYQRLCDNPQADVVPRVVLFGAKAAPAYHRAKLIIKLINSVADAINADPRMNDKLRVVFVPNYCVSLAEIIIPAADLSEQISLAGTEASGTGNMKFAMNGALTIGTLDGANIEIRDAVGPENFFLFGKTAEEVAELLPRHNPWHVYESNADVRRALDALVGRDFSPANPGVFRPIFDSLTRDGDRYLLLAELGDYAEAQRQVDALWRKPSAWTRAAILNVARVGHFSSDRSIREYAERIWNIQPQKQPAARRTAGKKEVGDE